MKKSTLIIIGVIYIASIVIISVFGLVPKIYRKVYPVTKIECLNETDEKTIVRKNGDEFTIIVKFTEPANANDMSGTILQLRWRVYPDNATDNNVQFIYDKTRKNFQFVQDESGRELGTVLFFAPATFNLTILAADGSGVKFNLLIRAIRI